MTKYAPYLPFRILIIVLLLSLHLPSIGQNRLSKVHKETISRYFEEVINNQKLSRMGAYFSRDYIWHQMNGVDVRSSQDSSHIAMLRFLFTAIPDIRYTIDHVVAEGDMIAVNSTVTGTAKSEMFGLPAAQKKVSFRQMFFFRIKNNKVTEEWEVVDVDGIKAQLAK